MRLWVILAISFFACSLFLVVPAKSEAGILDFALGSCAEVTQPCVVNTDEGTNKLNFVTGGFDLITTGAGAVPNSDLFVKSGALNETGLGLANDSSGVHEISPGEFVTLDFSNLANAGFTNGTLTLTSLQTGEGALVTDATGSHTVTQFDGTGIGTLGITFSKANPLVSIGSGAGSVLAASDVEVSVPEVSSLLLVTTGLFGLLLLKKRLL